MACDCTPCEIMDAVSIQSSDNSVSVERNDCGYDIKYLPNNLETVLKLKDGECVSFEKEFVDGVLTFTPQINYDCLAEKICGLCDAPPATAFCSPPIQLTVDVL